MPPLHAAVEEAAAAPQSGVQHIAAVTEAWSRAWLVGAFVLIWLVYWVQGLVTGVSGALLPYVASAFAEHALVPTTGVLSAVLGGVANMSIAKVLDLFGRPQGFLACAVLAAAGLAVAAACRSVEAYAASQVLYAVGIGGLGYSASVLVADTTSLRRRGLMQALVSSPNLVTCWLAGPVATAFLDRDDGWRWAFGLFAVLVPVVALPLFGLFQYQSVRAGRATRRGRRRRHCSPTWQAAVVHYARAFDAVGLLLVSAGAAFVLLPLNLYAQQARGWGSPLVVASLAAGAVLLVAFALWERYNNGAAAPLLPWPLLRDRTVLGACLLSFALFLSSACWSAYFGSFLQVVAGLSVTHASYVVQVQTVGSVLTALAAGALVARTGRYKPVSLYLAVPLMALALGLLVYSRGGGGGYAGRHLVGYLVLCQILVSVATGVLVITDEIAVMAAAAQQQQHFAVSIAVLGLAGNMGSAVGLSVSAALWQAVLPARLARYLPAADQPDRLLIYADLARQLSYPVGSPTRRAIQHAYADTQKDLLVAAAAVWALGAASVLLWRDIKVTGIKQTKGLVV